MGFYGVYVPIYKTFCLGTAKRLRQSGGLGGCSGEQRP